MVEGGPLLLVTPDAVPAETRQELERLAVERIVVLGGPSAVGAQVEEQLTAIAPVTRLAGESRFGTAAAIARHAWPDGAQDVLVATGADFADALAGGAAAGAFAAPVLLVTRDAIPAETAAELDRLAPQRITVLGGTAAVSPEVEAQLNDVAPTVRVAGDSRFATAANLAQQLWSGGATTVLVATGETFPDALAAAANAGHRRAPILLVTRDTAPVETLAALDALGAGTVVVAGGAATISEAVAGQLA